jgi:hypothetical protein
MDFVELSKFLKFLNGSKGKLWYLLSQIFTRHLNPSKEICFEHATSFFCCPCSNMSSNINISRCLCDLIFEIAISKHLRLLKNPNSQTREFNMGIQVIFPFTLKGFSPFMKLFSLKLIHLMSWLVPKFISCSGLGLGCKPKAKVVTIFIFMT